MMVVSFIAKTEFTMTHAYSYDGYRILAASPYENGHLEIQKEALKEQS
jgi:hypothetical protein